MYQQGTVACRCHDRFALGVASYRQHFCTTFRMTCTGRQCGARVWLDPFSPLGHAASWAQARRRNLRRLREACFSYEGFPSPDKRKPFVD